MFLRTWLPDIFLWVHFSTKFHMSWKGVELEKKKIGAFQLTPVSLKSSLWSKWQTTCVFLGMAFSFFFLWGLFIIYSPTKFRFVFEGWIFPKKIFVVLLDVLCVSFPSRHWMRCWFWCSCLCSTCSYTRWFASAGSTSREFLPCRFLFF